MEDVIKQVLDFIQTTGVILVKTGFNLAVRQEIIENLVPFILATIFVFILLLVILVAYKRYKLFMLGEELAVNKKGSELSKKELKIYNFYQENSLADVQEPFFWSVIAGIFVLLVYMLFASTWITHLLNPQWYAIERIINLVK